MDSGEILYRDYKEPLTPVGGGFGYMGTIGITKDGTKIQCHVCGGLFEHLSHHVHAKHGLKAQEYRQKFGLSTRVSLMSDRLRKKHVQTYQYLWSPEHREHLRELRKKAAVSQKNSGSYGKGVKRWSLERRNRAGNCPDQVVEKIKELATKLGRAPSYLEYIAEYGHGLMRSVINLHGTYSKAVKKAGFTTAYDNRGYNRVELLQMINTFRQQEGRDPTYSDFKRREDLPSYSTYCNVFGGIQEARREAHRLGEAAE